MIYQNTTNIKNYSAKVIIFTTDWCPPCKAYKKYLSQEIFNEKTIFFYLEEKIPKLIDIYLKFLYNIELTSDETLELSMLNCNFKDESIKLFKNNFSKQMDRAELKKILIKNITFIPVFILNADSENNYCSIYKISSIPTTIVSNKNDDFEYYRKSGQLGESDIKHYYFLTLFLLINEEINKNK